MSPMFAPATDKAEYELIEPGKYIATCTAIEDAPDKGFGVGVKWIFKLVDPNTHQTVQKKSGGDFELWQFTSTKMGPKARARPIIEALLGRPLVKGEVPDSRYLVGKAVTTILIHEQVGEDTYQRLTSLKPVQGTDTAPGPAPARPGFDANGATVNGNGDGHAALLEKVQKKARQAEVLRTPRHLEWLGLSYENLSDGDLMSFLNEINADIEAA